MGSLEHLVVRNMSAVERSEARIRTAMQSPEKLIEWIHASGKTWLVLNGEDLVKALPWPDGVELFMQVIQCYRDHRATFETGRHEEIVDPRTKEKHRVPIFKGESLEIEEMDRAVRYLIGQITQLDPNWKLDNPAL